MDHNYQNTASPPRIGQQNICRHTPRCHPSKQPESSHGWSDAELELTSRRRAEGDAETDDIVGGARPAVVAHRAATIRRDNE